MLVKYLVRSIVLSAGALLIFGCGGDGGGSGGGGTPPKQTVTEVININTTSGTNSKCTATPQWTATYTINSQQKTMPLTRGNNTVDVDDSSIITINKLNGWTADKSLSWTVQGASPSAYTLNFNCTADQPIPEGMISETIILTKIDISNLCADANLPTVTYTGDNKENKTDDLTWGNETIVHVTPNTQVKINLDPSWQATNSTTWTATQTETHTISVICTKGKASTWTPASQGLDACAPLNYTRATMSKPPGTASNTGWGYMCDPRNTDSTTNLKLTAVNQYLAAADENGTKIIDGVTYFLGFGHGMGPSVNCGQCH